MAKKSDEKAAKAPKAAAPGRTMQGSPAPPKPRRAKAPPKRRKQASLDDYVERVAEALLGCHVRVTARMHQAIRDALSD